MSQHERNGFRDQIYSEWHRSPSLGRYLGISKAAQLGLIDLDVTLWVEFDSCQFPLVLIETARDVGQDRKNARVTGFLADWAGLPAFCVLYRVEVENGKECITGFRVRQLAPKASIGWKSMDPQQYADFLIWARQQGAAAVDRRLRRDEPDKVLFDE